MSKAIIEHDFRPTTRTMDEVVRLGMTSEDPPYQG